MKRNSHTQTLFHYTRSRKSLISILNTGLIPSYASECYGDYGEVAIPMISFCDIPLNSSSEHVNKYGKYGIGLSKDYLTSQIKTNFGPIMYVIDYRQFDIAYKLQQQALNYVLEVQKELDTKIENKQANIYDINSLLYTRCNRANALSLFGFLKQYSMLRKGKLQINYDECEWRYVYPEGGALDGTVNTCKWFWNIQEFDKWKSERKNKRLEKSFCLTFQVKDIDFLLVPKEDDVITLSKQINKIDSICGHILDNEQRLYLQSKIISFEKINRII